MKPGDTFELLINYNGRTGLVVMTPNKAFFFVADKPEEYVLDTMELIKDQTYWYELMGELWTACDRFHCIPELSPIVEDLNDYFKATFGVTMDSFQTEEELSIWLHEQLSVEEEI